MVALITITVPRALPSRFRGTHEAQNSFSLSVLTEQPLDARHFAKCQDTMQREVTTPGRGDRLNTAGESDG